MQDVRKKIKALFVWMAEVKEELSKPQTPSLADLLIAYYNQRNAGAWSNKARTGNLKQFAEAVNYLTENKLLTLEDLQERLSSVSEEFEALSGSMKKKSARIKELQELIREGENYQRLKPVHTELNNIKFKKQREKFETSHDAELRLFYAARRILKEKLDGKPIALKAWKQEYAQLKTEYAELSPQHKPLREEVIRLRQVQNAVDTALRRREQPQAVQRKKHEIFFRMFVPIMRSTYGAAMTVTFMNAWNSYLWPKIIFQNNASITMPMLVANLKSGYSVDYGMLMLGVLICTLPTAIIFLCLQKSFANGITGAVK